MSTRDTVYNVFSEQNKLSGEVLGYLFNFRIFQDSFVSNIFPKYAQYIYFLACSHAIMKERKGFMESWTINIISCMNDVKLKFKWMWDKISMNVRWITDILTSWVLDGWLISQLITFIPCKRSIAQSQKESVHLKRIKIPYICQKSKNCKKKLFFFKNKQKKEYKSTLMFWLLYLCRHVSFVQ